MTHPTLDPVPAFALRDIASALRANGIDADAFPDGKTIGFGDVDIPHGYTFRLYLEGARPSGGYVVQITDQSGDELLAAASGDIAEVVSLVATVMEGEAD